MDAQDRGRNIMVTQWYVWVPNFEKQQYQSIGFRNPATFMSRKHVLFVGGMFFGIFDFCLKLWCLGQMRW